MGLARLGDHVMLIYIIHSQARQDREDNVQRLLSASPGSIVLDAVIDDTRGPIAGCMLSHQTAIEHAKRANAPAVLVFEDDAALTAHFDLLRLEALSAFAFISLGMDVFLGGVATARPIAVNQPLGLVELSNFSSTHCIVYNHTAYDTVLALKPYQHIDGAITESKLRKIVTVPFMAMQLNGYSDLRKARVDDMPTFIRAEEMLLNYLREEKQA